MVAATGSGDHRYETGAIIMMNWKRFLAITAVVHVVLTVWVRYDADARGVDPSPWDAVTLLAGIVGVAGYRRSR